MLLDLLKEQNLVKFYNNKLFENRIKIQEITFRNWDNLLYFFEGNFFFMPMIIGVLVVKKLSVWFGI